MIKVVAKESTELSWSFDGSHPTVPLGEHGGYATSEQVDPFPAYSHNYALAKNELQRVANAFPIAWPVTLYLLPYECIGRTNAFASASVFDYDKPLSTPAPNGDEYERRPFIVFSGKRIPIMPAMTRYLAAHEYGHIVEDWIAAQRGIKDHVLIREYADMRKMFFPKSYGGGWHLTPGEVFANDFRVLVCGAETEFWPHLVPNPLEVPCVIDWWNKASELKYFKPLESSTSTYTAKNVTITAEV